MHSLVYAVSPNNGYFVFVNCLSWNYLEFVLMIIHTYYYITFHIKFDNSLYCHKQKMVLGCSSYYFVHPFRWRIFTISFFTRHLRKQFIILCSSINRLIHFFCSCIRYITDLSRCSLPFYFAFCSFIKLIEWIDRPFRFIHPSISQSTSFVSPQKMLIAKPSWESREV